MKLYTIDIAVDKVKKSEYLSSLSGASKIKTLDRHCYLIHMILKSRVKHSLDHRYFTSIHSHDLKQVLGREYKAIINNLLELDIVEENKNYKAGSFTKSYRLKSDLFINGKIQHREIQSKWFNSKIENLYKSKVEETLNNLVLKKILQNTTKLHLIDEPVKFTPDRDYHVKTTYQITEDAPVISFGEFASNPNKVFRYEEFRKALVNLNSHNSVEKLVLENAYYEPSVVSSGRIYHMVASIPRKIRKGLRTKENEPIFEVDMASAQPSILMLEWIKSIGDKSWSSEVENCLELVLNGGIYNHIKKQSKYYQKLEYSELKKQVLRSLNYKTHAIESAKELMKVFPSFMSWIKKLKEINGHTYISQIGQSREAEIFVEVYKKLPYEMFALIIHDCILTTKKDLELVKSKLIERVKKLYAEVLPKEASLQQLFKTDRVSFTDEELSNKNWVKHVCSDENIKEQYMMDEYYSSNDYIPLE